MRSTLMAPSAHDGTKEVLPAAQPRTTSMTSFLARRLAQWREAKAQREILERLAAMDDRLLLDIGIAEHELADFRAEARFIPSGWAIRKSGVRNAA